MPARARYTAVLKVSPLQASAKRPSPPRASSISASPIETTPNLASLAFVSVMVGEWPPPRRMAIGLDQGGTWHRERLLDQRAGRLDALARHLERRTRPQVRIGRLIAQVAGKILL